MRVKTFSPQDILKDDSKHLKAILRDFSSRHFETFHDISRSFSDIFLQDVFLQDFFKTCFCRCQSSREPQDITEEDILRTRRRNVKL